MFLQAAAGALVLALDGESAAGADSTGIAVIALVSMVSGYVLLAGLWWFVFRDRSRARRRHEEREGGPPAPKGRGPLGG